MAGLRRQGPADPGDAGMAMSAALRFLAARPRSEAEVRRRLGRAFAPVIADDVIARLRTMGYLDDAAFAKWWREQRDRNRPKGALAIRQELRRLGVDAEAVESSLDGLDEEAAAIRAGGRRAQTLKSLPQRAFLEHLIPFLRRRGFATATARRAAQALWQRRQASA